MTNAVSLAQQASTGVSQGFKNRIINGAMVIDQRNAGASVTPTADDHTLDRWKIYRSVNGKMSIQQNAGSVTPPAGFRNYLGITSLSAYSVGASDYFLLEQAIEGFNTADWNFGSANAKTLTLSFWVYSSLTGTFTGAFTNEAYNRTFAFSYTISSANTWEYKTITIVGDTSGSWTGATNGIGIRMRFVVGAGSNRLTSSANQWIGSGADGVTGATSVVGTNGATLYITGVQLEVGSSATSFEYRPYTTELQLCQRYYQKSYDTNSAVPVVNSITGAPAIFKNNSIDRSFIQVRLKVEMRTAPTVTTYDYQGNSGKMAGGSFSSLTATSYQIATSGFNVESGTGNPGNDSYVNYAASAEI